MVSTLVFPISKKDAARVLDLDRSTVADVIRKHELPLVRIPYSNAHGIDRPTFERIKQIMTRVPPVPATAAN